MINEQWKFRFPHYNGRDVVAQHTVVGRNQMCAIMADIHGYTLLALGPKNDCYTRLEMPTTARCSRYMKAQPPFLRNKPQRTATLLYYHGGDIGHIPSDILNIQ